MKGYHFSLWDRETLARVPIEEWHPLIGGAHMILPDGVITFDVQHDYLMPDGFSLVPEKHRLFLEIVTPGEAGPIAEVLPEFWIPEPSSPAESDEPEKDG